MKFMFLPLLLSIVQYCQSQDYKDSIINLRVNHMAEITDTSYHILTQDEIDHFQGLAYFDVDSSYRIKAILVKDIGKSFEMITTTSRRPVYRRYGYVVYEINGNSLRLGVYQNMELKKKKEYKDYLFIPFKDASSGKETYGGGRYLDIEKSKEKSIYLDFNLVYNPYCVYSHRYSCPIPPEENNLNIEIRAGEKLPVGYTK